MIYIRHEGGLIHPLFGFQWTGGPILHFMPFHRRWRIKVRIRFTIRNIDGGLVWAPQFYIQRVWNLERA